MGTYTTNYNLYMPTVGEQGWGDLVNGNFSTIDTTMKSLSNRIESLETNIPRRNFVVTANSTHMGLTRASYYGGQMSYTVFQSMIDTISGTISCYAAWDTYWAGDSRIVFFNYTNSTTSYIALTTSVQTITIPDNTNHIAILINTSVDSDRYQTGAYFGFTLTEIQTIEE